MECFFLTPISKDDSGLYYSFMENNNADETVLWWLDCWLLLFGGAAD